MLTKLLESNTFKYLKGFKELLGVLLFLAPFLVTPLNPDLITVVRKESLVVPISMGPQLPQKSSPAGSGLSLLTIELINRSSDPIQGVELVVNGIEEVAASSAISTSARLTNETPDLGKIERTSKQTFHFPHITSIPPRQALMVQIAGRFNEQFMFTPRVEVTSSAKSSRVVHTVPVSGVFGFIYENSRIIIAVFFVFLVGLGLRRISSKDSVV